MLTISEINTEITKIFSIFSNILSNIAIDRRDEWPTNKSSYAKADIITSGEFGIVRSAELRNPVTESNRSDTRKCVIKTIYLRRRLEKILGVFGDYAYDNLQLKSNDEKIFRFIRRTVMDLYVLNRCRHENIMHSHAMYLSGGDLHIVMPRFYVLDKLIEMYRPISVLIIAKIVRQLCRALEFLQGLKIMHRDVQPENIYLTRNGTVKLAHFGQARIVLDDALEDCKTPVGKENYMCFEKLHNLLIASSIDNCQSYSFSSDIWSLGVLVLAMVSYFPEEPFHKLPKDFALIMQKENIPFHWLTVNMIQLRARLNRSGGEMLKSFLSQKLLTINVKDRVTASSLQKTLEMLKWCFANVDDDKNYLRKKFIDDLDFANQSKLDPTGPNYDHLETKDIPPKYYWDDTWKELEVREFLLEIFVDQSKIEKKFTLSNIQPLFPTIYTFVQQNIVEWFDVIPLDCHIRELCYELIEKEKLNLKCKKRITLGFLEKNVSLIGFNCPSKSLQLSVSLLPLYRSSSISTDDTQYTDDEN